MSEKCNRIKEERSRLGLSQAAFGALGGVSRVAQESYEAGRRDVSTAYLAAIAAAGVDVMYILTGVRQGAAPKPAKGLEEYPEVGAAEIMDAIDQMAELMISTGTTLPPKKLASSVRLVTKVLADDARKRKDGEPVAEMSRLREMFMLLK
ncbi:MAG: helix-turn-helix transcriptional regulator [Magnetococcales bacterium]|nr:helix-turn-helix transcriptional regulator [Magnetococcales bacterium]